MLRVDLFYEQLEFNPEKWGEHGPFWLSVTQVLPTAAEAQAVVGRLNREREGRSRYLVASHPALPRSPPG